MNVRCLLGFVLGLAMTHAIASEGGGSNYLPGFYGDFAMAVIPDEGTFFNNFFAAYSDRSGKVGSALEMPGIIHVTQQSFFGGRFLLGAYPGLVGAWDSRNNQGRFGLGDAYLVPAALNWKWQNLSLLAFEGIVAPTGFYEKGALNAGRNVWTFDHVLGMTWTLPANFDLSLVFGYMNNLQNHATHYKTGDEFHFDYTLGYYLKDDLAVGVTGSFYQQTTSDQAPAGTTIAVRGSASTIGPAFMFTPRFGDTSVNMSLKWLHEFNVDGRSPQDYLIWRAFMPF